MSDDQQPPGDGPPETPPAPATPPEPPTAPPAAAPPAAPPEPAPAVTKADLDAVVSDFRAALTEAVGGLTKAGAPAAGDPPAQPAKARDPRSWVQRMWFGPKRY